MPQLTRWGFRISGCPNLPVGVFGLADAPTYPLGFSDWRMPQLTRWGFRISGCPNLPVGVFGLADAPAFEGFLAFLSEE